MYLAAGSLRDATTRARTAGGDGQFGRHLLPALHGICLIWTVQYTSLILRTSHQYTVGNSSTFCETATDICYKYDM
jgi:hypothetical protein